MSHREVGCPGALGKRCPTNCTLAGVGNTPHQRSPLVRIAGRAVDVLNEVFERIHGTTSPCRCNVLVGIRRHRKSLNSVVDAIQPIGLGAPGKMPHHSSALSEEVFQAISRAGKDKEPLYHGAVPKPDRIQLCHHDRPSEVATDHATSYPAYHRDRVHRRGNPPQYSPPRTDCSILHPTISLCASAGRTGCVSTNP